MIYGSCIVMFDSPSFPPLWKIAGALMGYLGVRLLRLYKHPTAGIFVAVKLGFSYLMLLNPV